MDNEVVKILRVETQGSERTVKSLKDEISSLKDALLNTEQGTEQYDNIIKQLRQDTADLTRVMNAGKEQVEDLDGSYNKLVKTMSELKKQWRATNDEATRNELGEQIANINTQLKEMDASIGNYQRNVGNYADGFSQAMREQAEATEVSRKKLESIQKVASGLAGAYSATQGVMALLGTENKELEKTFIKLQSAIAIAQGIGGMKDLIEGAGQAKVAFSGAITGVKSFITSLNGVKGAIVGTGIGLLVVSLGTLISHLIQTQEEAKNTKSELEKLNEEFEKNSQNAEWWQSRDYTQIYREYVEAVKKAGNDVNAINKANADYEAKLNEQRLKDAEAKEKHYNDKYEELSQERFRLSKSNRKKDKEELEKVNKELQEVELQRTKATEEVNKIKAENAKKTADEIVKATEEQNNRIAEANKKAIEDKKKTEAELKKEQEKAIAIADNARKSLIDTKEEELAELKRIYDEELALLQKHGVDTTALTDKYTKDVRDITEKHLLDNFNESNNILNGEQNKATQELELKYSVQSDNPVQAIQDEINYITELSNIESEFNNKRVTEIETLLSAEQISAETRKTLENERMALIEENYYNEQRLAIEQSELEKRLDKEKLQRNINVATSTLDVTANMLSSIGGLMEEGSEEAKGIAIASATIQAISSAISAYNSASQIPVVGMYLAPIASATALIAGMANVKKIADTNADGSNAEAQISSAQASMNVGVMPTFDVNSQMPIDYTRNVMTDAEITEMNKAQRVYVLESDITEAQRHVEVVEDSASF